MWYILFQFIGCQYTDFQSMLEMLLISLGTYFYDMEDMQFRKKYYLVSWKVICTSKK
jgi:hypothetical protein